MPLPEVPDSFALLLSSIPKKGEDRHYLHPKLHSADCGYCCCCCCHASVTDWFTHNDFPRVSLFSAAAGSTLLCSWRRYLILIHSSHFDVVFSKERWNPWYAELALLIESSNFAFRGLSLVHPMSVQLDNALNINLTFKEHLCFPHLTGRGLMILFVMLAIKK